MGETGNTTSEDNTVESNSAEYETKGFFQAAENSHENESIELLESSGDGLLQKSSESVDNLEELPQSSTDGKKDKQEDTLTERVTHSSELWENQVGTITKHSMSTTESVLSNKSVLSNESEESTTDDQSTTEKPTPATTEIVITELPEDSEKKNNILTNSAVVPTKLLFRFPTYSTTTILSPSSTVISTKTTTISSSILSQEERRKEKERKRQKRLLKNKEKKLKMQMIKAFLKSYKLNCPKDLWLPSYMSCRKYYFCVKNRHDRYFAMMHCYHNQIFDINTGKCAPKQKAFCFLDDKIHVSNLQI